MSRSVIFALDGVLANHEHRRVPEGTDVPWREEYDQNRMEEDAPYRDMLKLCQQLGERNSILIITERPITVMEVTRKWLGGVDVEFDMLYMKQDVKRRSATDVKSELLEKMIGEKEDPWLLIDHDPEVIRRAAKSGIRGLLV